MRCFVGGLLLSQAFSLQHGEYELVAHLRQHNLADFEKLFWDISNPDHSRYLDHLSVAQIADKIGATDTEIDTARDWLLKMGAQDSSIQVSALRDTITATFAAEDGRREPHLMLSTISSQKPPSVEFVLRRDIQVEVPTLTTPRHATDAPDSMYVVPKIKAAYGIPADLKATNDTTLQMVWGPGTFGYSKIQLGLFKASQCPLLDMSKIKFDTQNHGQSGGDNYGEGNLDTQMISAFGLNVETLVSNTNTSSSTEEGVGFGQAMLDFVTELSSRSTIPQVLSLSLGSLSAASCKLLCDAAVKEGHSQQECQSYIQQQRQVCMYLSEAEVTRIDTALQILGARGVSVFGSSGDGGSHFSFGRFQGGEMADLLNKISCKYQMPVYPTTSKYIISVGGEMWENGDSSRPTTWSGSGGGFSWQMEMPEHQKQAVANYLLNTSGLPLADSFNAKGRAYPDISSIAVMGTSQSSPMTAGIFSMLVDMRLNKGLPPLGFVAPLIWKVAQDFPGEAFEDIPTGNSKTSCDSGFPSVKSNWDPNTGWGRPIWEGMMKHFAVDNRRSKEAIIV